MKTTTGILAILILLAVALPSAADAQVRFRLDLGVTARGIHGYDARLGAAYGVPAGDIRYIYLRGIPARDIPVVVYLKTHTPYSYRHIIGLRLNGATWMELFTWCGIPREMYDPGFGINGPPYGNANGYYRHGKGRWKHGRGVTDEEIRLWVEYYYADGYNSGLADREHAIPGEPVRPGHGRVILGEDVDDPY